jgi:hypothetical protein
VPIKNYLVIEAGLTPFFDNGGHADWDFDLLFRHSFEMSKKVEFEPGIGPTWSGSGQVGAVASFEFMIWPWQERFCARMLSKQGRHQDTGSTV